MNMVMPLVDIKWFKETTLFLYHLELYDRPKNKFLSYFTITFAIKYFLSARNMPMKLIQKDRSEEQE